MCTPLLCQSISTAIALVSPSSLFFSPHSQLANGSIHATCHCCHESGDEEFCTTLDCPAYITGDKSRCESGNCRAFFESDERLCSGIIGWESSADCKAYITKGASLCTTENCVAYITKDPYLCGVPPFLTILLRIILPYANFLIE